MVIRGRVFLEGWVASKLHNDTVGLKGEDLGALKYWWDLNWTADPSSYHDIAPKKITCLLLAQSTQTCFHRKITYAMLSQSACANIAQENYM